MAFDEPPGYLKPEELRKRLPLRDMNLSSVFENKEIYDFDIGSIVLESDIDAFKIKLEEGKRKNEYIFRNQKYEYRVIKRNLSKKKLEEFSKFPDLIDITHIYIVREKYDVHENKRIGFE